MSQESENRQTMFSFMKKNTTAQLFEKSPHVQNKFTDYSNLPKEVKQIVKRKKADKIWFFPAFSKKPSSFNIELNTEDLEWNSHYLHDTKEFILLSSRS